MATAFVIDHMLIKLGKYLRIAGYDAVWDPGLRTHELIRMANAQGRVFVTRNARLPFQYPPPILLVTLAGTDPVEQFRELQDCLGLDVTSRLFTRCIRCNVALEDIARERVKDRVHPTVYSRHERFFTCPACGTVFWKGGHVRNTCDKLHLPVPAEG